MEFLAVEQLAHAAVKIAQFLLVERVIQAEHHGTVPDLNETLTRLASHSLARRIGGDQSRVLRFERLQLAHEGIVLRIGDFRLVENIVQVFVVPQHISKLVDFPGRIFHRLSFII